MRLALFIAAFAVACCAGVPAFAHDPVTSSGPERWASVVNVTILLVLWIIYLFGARRIPSRRGRWLMFHLALLLSIVATLGPLDKWAETNEAVHMAQHMMFMVVIAPLFVISRPAPQLIKGLGQVGARLWNPVLRLTPYPMITAYVHCVAIWFWHVPYFYVLALQNPWWHIVEHVCFILTAGVFWWAVLKSSRTRGPWALMAVLFTLMHTGFLGALLTFAAMPLYGPDRDLADQQLAGVIMWVAGGIPYTAASAWIALRWYRQIRPELQKV